MPPRINLTWRRLVLRVGRVYRNSLFMSLRVAVGSFVWRVGPHFSAAFDTCWGIRHVCSPQWLRGSVLVLLA